MAWKLCESQGVWKRGGEYLSLMGLDWTALLALLGPSNHREAIIEACRFIEAGALDGDGERIKSMIERNRSQGSSNGG
jgi:hypothetical protein